MRVFEVGSQGRFGGKGWLGDMCVGCFEMIHKWVHWTRSRMVTCCLGAETIRSLGLEELFFDSYGRQHA